MNDMKPNPVKEKSFAFSIEIVKTYKQLAFGMKEYVMSKQLLRSGTAIGALIHEAQFAQSKADFIHKLSISLKEANETLYWIQLLSKSGYLNENETALHKSCDELISILVSIIKTSKAKN